MLFRTTRFRAALVAVTLAALPLAALADELHPLGTVTLPTLIGKVIAGFLSILGTVSFVMFVWGGVQYMTAQGNDKMVESGKKTFIRAILGLVLTFSAYTIVRFTMNSVIQGSIRNLDSASAKK